MKKGRTVGGDPGYCIKLETIFTLRSFSTALASVSFNNPIDFKTLKKKEALKILFTELRQSGLHGQYEGLDDLGDLTEEFNKHYEKAEIWIKKNYPYLIKK